MHMTAAGTTHVNLYKSLARHPCLPRDDKQPKSIIMIIKSSLGRFEVMACLHASLLGHLNTSNNCLSAFASSSIFFLLGGMSNGHTHVKMVRP